jgi:hypothetical protein
LAGNVIFGALVAATVDPPKARIVAPHTIADTCRKLRRELVAMNAPHRKTFMNKYKSLDMMDEMT